MISIQDSKSIIKHEYGKNLSVLVITDANEDVEVYVDFFVDLFKNAFICDDYQSAHMYWDRPNRNYDIVIVHINKEVKEASELICKIREDDSSIFIVVFSSDGDVSKHHASEHCFYADATLPYPFDSEFSYKFLYRFLKRISDLKDLESYVFDLESSLDPQIKNEISKPYEQIKENKKISDEKLKHIRFNQPNKINATDFLKTLDVTIIDKIELFQEDLDDYTMALYDIEEDEPDIALERLQKVIEILNEFSYIVGNMIVFPVIEETFKGLSEFLNSLDAQSMQDKDQKKLLVETLLGIGKDLELWIKTIFIEANTDDVHYFDASFANNTIEIEALFHKNGLEIADDESELEFF
jgi:hypothetical protein